MPPPSTSQPPAVSLATQPLGNPRRIPRSDDRLGTSRPLNGPSGAPSLERLCSQVVRLSRSAAWAAAGLAPLRNGADPLLEGSLATFAASLDPDGTSVANLHAQADAPSCADHRGHRLDSGLAQPGQANIPAAQVGSRLPPQADDVARASSGAGLASLLEQWKLGGYLAVFLAAGYDDIAEDAGAVIKRLRALSDEQLMALAQRLKMKPGHAMKLCDKAHGLRELP